ncbi:MAG TPA: phosphodiester glycosidase family protein [Micromonosporaceae bacterium]
MPFRSRRRLTAAALLLGAALAVPTGVPPAASAAADASWLPPTPDQWPLVVDEQVSADETITRGLTHHSDTLQTAGGAQRAQVINADLTDTNLRLGVVEAHDHLTDPPNETISSMANRTGAVAGINADFFEMYNTGRPLGMVVIDGHLEKSPNPGWTASLWQRADGSIAVGTETYTGTAADGSASHTVASVNTVGDIGAGKLVRLTPYLGPTGTLPAFTLVTGVRDGDALLVGSVQTGLTSVDTLPAGVEALAGAGEAGTWLAGTVHVGDRVTLSEHLAPDDDVRLAVSGGAILVKDGKMAVPLHGGGENNVSNPVTGVGVTQDGRHLVVAAFDGHQPEGVAQGLTRPQLAGWMMQHGAYNAILFDSGGSTQMVGRHPGDTSVSVLNVPSDGHERPVANGLFFYTTAGSVGPAAHAVVNDGKPLTVLRDTSVKLQAYSTDARFNPTRDPLTFTVRPPTLATVVDGVLTANHPGNGTLTVRAGDATGTIPLRVAPHLDTLTVDPAQVDLGNGDHQRFTVTGVDPDGRTVTLPDDAITWSVDPASLGSIDGAGAFTAATDGAILGTVTAKAGGATGTSSVAVGEVAKPIDPLDDVSYWSASATYMNVYPRKVPSPGPDTADDGSIAAAPDVSPPGSTSGSLRVHYHYPAQNKVYDLDMYLDDPETRQVPLLNGTQVPTGIGVWVKGNADLASRPGAGLQPGIVTLNIGIWQATNQPTSFYPTGITFDGWQFVVAKLPVGLQYPLRINYLALVVIKPDVTLDGDVYLSGLTALYSPRPPTPFVYRPLPTNPSWLKFTDVDSFTPGGATLAAMDDAHVRASDPGGTGPTVMRSIASALPALPAPAHPDAVQALGDMPDSGTLDNLGYAKSLLAGLGVPYRDAVGNHEITQGANPENRNFASVFGATHYAYDVGPAKVIVTDSGHIGVLASDAFQSPNDGPQYQWLVDQLSANTSPVTVVVTHAPAYDPHPRADSQFADRWEARMYEALMQRYQRTHPNTHVLLLFGHSRGFSETMIDPSGANTTAEAGGLPNFVVADAGSPPYAPTDQGGFYHYALFHALPDGTVEFAVQPVFASVTVAPPAGPLAVGGTVTLTATGTTVTGDDATALTVPIADPVSRRWSSSDPAVATVDPATGEVTGVAPGTATVSCVAGGVTATVTVTVR